MSTKENWPEFEGKDGMEAEAGIKKENPNLAVHIMPENAPCTMDYRTDRVRIFVDKDGKVISTPSIG